MKKRIKIAYLFSVMLLVVGIVGSFVYAHVLSEELDQIDQEIKRRKASNPKLLINEKLKIILDRMEGKSSE